MKLGKLEFGPVEARFDLVAKPVEELVKGEGLKDVLVAEIDPNLADTAAFCEHYQITLEESANCVIVEAKRADRSWYAACVIQGAARADVNGAVRRHLGARKASFAPMATATDLTGMEYGGINPIGLPADWPILVDTRVAALEWALIGSGVRRSKLLVPGRVLAQLPGAHVMDIALG